MHRKLRMMLCVIAAVTAAPASKAEIKLPDAAATPTNAPGRVIAAAPARATGEGRLKLMNGDRVSGGLESMSAADGILVLRHAAARDPVAFRLDALDQFESIIAQGDSPAPAGGWMVELTNGDRLQGTIREITETRVLLDTWYAGPLAIERPMVQRMVQMVGSGQSFYEGPGGAGWNTLLGTARFSETSVSLQPGARVSREIGKTAKRFRLDVKAEWSMYAYFSIGFSADDANLENGEANGYSLMVQGMNTVMLMRFTKNQGSRRIGHYNYGMNSDGRPAQMKLDLSLFCDLEKNKFWLYRDGLPVAEWSDSQAAPAPGKFLALGSQNTPVTIRNLRISAWDGRLPSRKDASPSEENKTDSLLLRNGDAVSGTLKEARNGQCRMSTTYGALSIPMENIETINAASSTARARRNKNDLRFELIDGSLITADVSSLREGRFTGQSENFTSIQLPLDTVRKLNLNIYAKRKGDDDEEENVPPAVRRNVPIRVGQGAIMFK